MNKHLPFLYIRPLLMSLVFPWIILWLTHATLADKPLRTIGLIITAIGFVALASTQWQLYRPSQWTAQKSSFGVPNKLVVTGFYKYVCNAQLWSIYLTVLGLGLMYASWAVIIYLIVIIIPSSTVAVRVEEPQLTEKFGDSYLEYKNCTARFIPGVF
jgi:protein-S-isoprenylcysteine O-methyltransferase Ste14